MIVAYIKEMPLAMNLEEARRYVGAERVFDDMRKAGWLKPLNCGGGRLVLFDRKDIETAYARVYAGEYPTV